MSVKQKPGQNRYNVDEMPKWKTDRSDSAAEQNVQILNWERKK